jgi:peptidoglycan/LPS O-acetylase OafA/YrhL
MWWGMAAGQWVLSIARTGWAHLCRKPGHGSGVLGRWSLSWYMLHQPVLMGGLIAWIWLARP